MPKGHISSEFLFLNFVRAQDIWEQISLFKKYAGFIPEIDKIVVRSENCSEWFITLDNAPFTWVETDLFDCISYILKFNCIGGDFEIFEGCWSVIRDTLNQIKLKLEFDYFLGIPVLEDLMSNVIKEKMQRFADSMINTHSNYVQSHSKNTRKTERFLVNSNKQITIDGRAVEAHIINISTGGVMFTLSNGMILSSGKKELKIVVDTLQITGNLQHESFSKVYRIVFAEKLSEETLKSLLSMWNDPADSEIVKVFEVLTSESYVASDTIAGN